ncbi:TusE/DsrC/DsvC family sulfur relay protein [Thiohalobacter sp. IOR34]|uniref:TusE/DsrC/DsvC family sulfur relay protein n=1 Tax=Thiohalobacter sp. IOR34 TaxID=3057176 RepID=UPI0025B10171|nr:TusE/DsrC/DsvC family sulfur relay protein [Thiohalobacter sp. IOR34]WJW76381.1 TusE/DsrC/DsvC family sulfur relay protein [Thiohalobacter sp. IOR34]
MSIEVNGLVIETDEQGYLLDPNLWTEEVAKKIAEQEGVELTDTHWGLIRYFRDFYEMKQRHPTMHELVLTQGKHHGESFQDAEAYRDHLWKLFPKGPVIELSKLAGLPKPEEVVS